MMKANFPKYGYSLNSLYQEIGVSKQAVNQYF
ncbi:unnamed protein product, partial [marine sediment metagenome]